VFAVSKLQALKSANLSLFMYLLTFWGTIEYVQNPWYAVPIAAASWLGTYITVLNEKRKVGKE
jgi:hypothetical protein